MPVYSTKQFWSDCSSLGLTLGLLSFLVIHVLRFGNEYALLLDKCS